MKIILSSKQAAAVAYTFGEYYFVGFQIPKKTKGWKKLMDSLPPLEQPQKMSALKKTITFLLLSHDKTTPTKMPVQKKLLRKPGHRTVKPRSRVQPKMRKGVRRKVRSRVS